MVTQKAATDSAHEPKFMRLADTREEWLNETISRKLVVGEKEMLGFVSFKKGAIVPAHKHVSEQITLVFKGSIRFRIGAKEYTVRRGEVLVIPSNVVHEAVALEETDSVDCFTPLRHDWLSGKDLYLRTGKSYLKPGSEKTTMTTTKKKKRKESRQPSSQKKR